MQKEEKWLVGLSGGPDSMALLGMCLKQGIPVAAAHVNYHHRLQAEEEEVYVRQFCKEHGIELYVRNEPFTYAGNFEAQARQWRYDFFVSIVKQHHYKGVLVAHHMDDLIETFIMQEEKNLVPEHYGLAEEICYKGILVRRPLLHHTKAQLVSWCEENSIHYYVDATNLSDAYTRNRIRHSIVEQLSDSDRMLYLKEIERRNAEKQERECRVNAIAENGPVLLSLYRSMVEEDRIALLRAFVEKDGHHHSLAFMKEVDRIIMEHDDFIIPFSSMQLVQEDGYLRYEKQSEPYAHVYASLDQMQHVSAEWYVIENGSPGVNALSLHDYDFPIVIRNARKGDVITMRFGNKKVHRFFIDRHIPKWRRKQWPVIENAGGKVIFVAGLGCDANHYTVKPDVNVLSLYHYTKD